MGAETATAETTQKLWDDGTAEGDQRVALGTAGFVKTHRKEVSFGLGSLFAMLAFVGVLNYIDPEDLHNAEKWEKQHWVEAPCDIEQAGIAYRGNCHMDVTLMMTRYNKFAECMGPEETSVNAPAIFSAWGKSEAGRCAAIGDDAYRRHTGKQVNNPYPAELPPTVEPPAGEGAVAVAARRLPGAGDGAAVGSYNDGSRVAAALRPQDLAARFLPGANIDCHNNYLPWALVKVMNESNYTNQRRCAYEFGASAPSITGDWDAIMHLYHRLKGEKETTCWVLTDDDCVVAFEDQHLLTQRERRRNKLVIISGIICGTLAVIMLAVGCVWNCRERGRCPLPTSMVGSLPAIRGYEPVPQEPGATPQVPLSERVRHIMSVVASRFDEETPTASGASTLRVAGDRSQRTLDLGRAFRQTTGAPLVPRNVAADFLAR